MTQNTLSDEIEREEQEIIDLDAEFICSHKTHGEIRRNLLSTATAGLTPSRIQLGCKVDYLTSLRIKAFIEGLFYNRTI